MNRCGTGLGRLEKCPETLQTLKWGRVRPRAHLWSGPHHLMSCVMSVPLGSMESGGAGPQRNGLPQSWQPHQRGSGSPTKQLGCPLLAIAPSAPHHWAGSPSSGPVFPVDTGVQGLFHNQGQHWFHFCRSLSFVCLPRPRSQTSSTLHTFYLIILATQRGRAYQPYSTSEENCDRTRCCGLP